MSERDCLLDFFLFDVLVVHDYLWNSHGSYIFRVSATTGSSSPRARQRAFFVKGQ